MSKLYVIAGQPGSGKTTLAMKLVELDQSLIYISIDDIKENLFDTIGFRSVVEKANITKFSHDVFFQTCTYCFEQNINLIIDYPFSHKQDSFFNSIKTKYDVDIKTIVLYGDCETLYMRTRKRNRHLGHESNYYFHGEAKEFNELTYEEYVTKCNASNYKQFSYYDTSRIDTSDIKIEEYHKVLLDILRLS